MNYFIFVVVDKKKKRKKGEYRVSMAVPRQVHRSFPGRGVQLLSSQRYK